MDYLERAKLINKVIEDGHEIIDKMRPSQTFLNWRNLSQLLTNTLIL